jgi:hypothetical protein
VGAERGLAVGGRLGRGVNEADLVAGDGAQAVQGGQGGGREFEECVEACEDEGDDGVRVLDVGLEERAVFLEAFWGWERVG